MTRIFKRPTKLRKVLPKTPPGPLLSENEYAAIVYLFKGAIPERYPCPAPVSEFTSDHDTHHRDGRGTDFDTDREHGPNPKIVNHELSSIEGQEGDASRKCEDEAKASPKI